MRIIAGIAKGMTLVAPRGDVRPTSDRVREAIFSSLGERVVGATVLDLFAGSGALGLEAASRGASAVTFVENARASLDAIERNLESFRRNRGVSCVFRVLRADAFKLPALEGEYSLIFADPPYGDAAQKFLVLPLPLAPGGLVVLESAKRDALTPGETWNGKREAIYGDTRVSFLVRTGS
ncbi:MAG: 16S rRNA (guanine(966)-N(2))-methyltransferase RsmD [Verrucomicrobia bacterium]|nr:16S rRNA (guanine(966)-N(2))-methyltransferase RsmD [Verrucomicrobiota bacterium]